MELDQLTGLQMHISGFQIVLDRLTQLIGCTDSFTRPLFIEFLRNCNVAVVYERNECRKDTPLGESYFPISGAPQ